MQNQFNNYQESISSSFSRLSLKTTLGGRHSPHFGHGRPGEVVCGPLLRYIRIDYVQRIWHGSIVVVSDDHHAPPLVIQFNSKTKNIHGTKLDSYRHKYHFWRYELQIPILEREQKIIYSTPHNNWGEPQFDFYIPSIFDSMRFVFYSCNGFSDIPQNVKDKFGEKTAPLWQDVLDRHQVLPFHVFLGGGDQLYQDRLIKEDFMKPWNAEKNPAKRIAMQLSQQMKDGFEEFYFSNYCINFGFKDNPIVAKAFASVPSVNMWDDHDIIDGYGSYPADMQHADCFQVLFANATRFYYLFQHHTTLELVERHGFIKGSLDSCNHIVTSLGPDLGLVSLDCRGERTKQEICTEKSYKAVFNYINSDFLPSTMKHLMILTGVPLIYPRLTLFENLMDGAANFNLATIAGKTGALGDLIKGSLNVWNGDPELLDDMNDHWTAGCHVDERKLFIERLQAYAREKSIRVSFLGGDVHCCGAGKLYSKDMKKKEEGDPYFMVQIISSAIVNVPPPQALLTILNQNSSYITFNGNIEERMYNIFKNSPNGNSRQNKKLMGMRNYCAGYYDEATGKLNFWIQAEKEVGKKGTMGYLVDVPKLIFGQAGYHLSRLNKREYLACIRAPERQHHRFQRLANSKFPFAGRMPDASNYI